MYCTAADIEAPERDLIQLTDDEGLGVVNSDVIDKAIAKVDELIDGYLRSRYALPLDPVPGLLTTLAADIVLYRLYCRRAVKSLPEALADKYKNALKLLDNIRTGAISLGCEQLGGVITPVESSEIAVTAGAQIFSPTVLEKY